MCQKSGKTLIPIDKPQVYFVDVVKCVITEMTHLALPTASNARRPSEPAYLNSVGNLIPLTDQPPAYPGPTITGGRAGGLDKEAD